MEGIGWRVVVVAGALALSGSGVAMAASFTSLPPPYAKSGTNVTWEFKTDDPGGTGTYSATAYTLGTNNQWHRCGPAQQSVTLGAVPDGRYQIAIADDVNENAAPIGSGTADECLGDNRNNTNSPDGGFTATDTVFVDSHPPSVQPPALSNARREVYASTSATDTGSGVAMYAWRWGDGTSDSGQDLAYASHTYASYGRFGGTVTVTDKTGNATTVPFHVNLVAPDTKPPRVNAYGQTSQRLVHQKGIKLELTCSEPCNLGIYSYLTVSGIKHHYALRNVSRVSDHGITDTKVFIPASRSVRATIARDLRHHRQVQAEIDVDAVDAAGNRGAYGFLINVRA